MAALCTAVGFNSYVYNTAYKYIIMNHTHTIVVKHVLLIQYHKELVQKPNKLTVLQSFPEAINIVLLVNDKTKP